MSGIRLMFGNWAKVLEGVSRLRPQLSEKIAEKTRLRVPRKIA